MNFVQFGHKRILRPSRQTATEFHNRARAALLRHFKPGTYYGRAEVNPILNLMEKRGLFAKSFLKVLMEEETVRIDKLGNRVEIPLFVPTESLAFPSNE